jgi:hypothetical protein
MQPSIQRGRRHVARLAIVMPRVRLDHRGVHVEVGEPFERQSVLFDILRAFGWIEFDLHHLLWQQNMLKSMCGRRCLTPRARRGVRQFGRIEKTTLNRARQPMHQALADLAGLSAGLELLGDLLQKLGPPLLIDRSGQA